jgi:hypothetical protein
MDKDLDKLAADLGLEVDIDDVVSKLTNVPSKEHCAWPDAYDEFCAKPVRFMFKDLPVCAEHYDFLVRFGESSCWYNYLKLRSVYDRP